MRSPPTHRVSAGLKQRRAYNQGRTAHTAARRYGHIAPVWVGLQKANSRVRTGDGRRRSTPSAPAYKREVTGDGARVEQAKSEVAARRTGKSHVTQNNDLRSLHRQSRQPEEECSCESRYAGSRAEAQRSIAVPAGERACLGG